MKSTMMDAEVFWGAVRERMAYSESRAFEYASKADKFGEKKNSNGVVERNQGHDYRQVSAEWARDAYDCMVLLNSNTEDERRINVTVKNLRWLYKHLAPESIHHTIGAYDYE